MSESFEDVMAYAQAVIADCDIPILDSLQRAHDHDMELADKSAYHRGYEDGQHSMDAEHRAVAMRLQALRLDEGSYENLSAIARAIMYCESYFGWTQGACAELRDELIRLLGGVHDDPVPVATSGDAGCDGCDRRDGETGRVTYDELGNERHEAVCALRKIQTDAGGFVKALAEAVGVEWQAPRVTQTIAEVRDRIIHLLGGDETETSLGTSLSQASVDAMSGRAESDDSGEVTITDELRECVRTADRQYDDTLWYEMGEDSEADHTICLVTEGELLRVADRIDEWFKRLCEQHEAVLQKTIDEMAEFREHEAEYASTERDELQAKLIEHKALYRHYKDLYTQCVAERDELQERLERSRAEYCETCEEAETSDVLRAKLDAVREALDGQR